MTRNERSPDQNGGSGQWLKSNLSALGSATVFAVYAAGFIRTRDAAASLQDLPVRRVHTATLAAPATSGIGSAAPAGTAEATGATASAANAGRPVNVAGAAPPSVRPAAAPVAAERSTVQTPAVQPAIPQAPSAAKPSAQPPTPQHVVAAPTAAPTSTAKASAALPATTVAAAPVTAAPVSVPQPTPAPVKSAPVTPAPTPVPAASAPTPGPTPAPTAATSAPATPAAAQRVGFKDGTFVGYGRSRHGDIELTVDIVNGQIIDATITQCLTEYSCSWIVALPPEIVARQSAEVDIVSGATASSDAFYAAALQALSKAK